MVGSELLAKMDFTTKGAIGQASRMFQMERNSKIPFASFEPNLYPGWAHTRKNIHLELTTMVSSAGRLERTKILVR